MSHLPEHIVSLCKQRLIEMKTSLINQFNTIRQDLNERSSSGDEIDQSINSIAENQFLTTQSRIRKSLIEIELALGRIDSGTFGFCEETEEPIETERLLALPYTRLSIEGAEIREAMNRKNSHRA